MKKDTLFKVIAVIGMSPFVVYFLNLLLTVAPVFTVLYAALLLYGILGAGKR